MRDLGVYLYVTEIASVLSYWFDIHGIVFDPKYPKPIASMVFGGGYGYSTWWTEEPRQIHGINLPDYLGIISRADSAGESAVGYRVHEGAQSQYEQQLN